ncbi:class I SAM-dependent methyltransferase [Solihabitans fulvus]|uniref:Class I SAM-dependent methyltransferase n=1 Tax=Solihabitans fulvus TaxID=1892852 RepID=A0A5B2XJ93_9PSEU|nr:class I SAM-dependent methyltransferase [Solihabitans fulvus]KAA2262822.1 class I SAM-dependent methyltransferase [Solihabitans fulvus]
MTGHTHDGVDWPARLVALRRADQTQTAELRTVAERLVSATCEQPTVLDIGSGAGGMSVALASELDKRGGGTLILVDAVPELLDAATSAARAAANGAVRVRPVLADVAKEPLRDLVPPADLIWAARVVHHLPDQRHGLDQLVGALAPGGWLALAEGGLETRCLPWDIGIGAPGLQDRLAAARAEWFASMRADMPDSTRLPVGWNIALAEAGLGEVSAFSYLIDHPAPISRVVADSVMDWLRWLGDVSVDKVSDEDTETVRRLLDPDDPAYVGSRQDVFLLQTLTVHLGRAAWH